MMRLRNRIPKDTSGALDTRLGNFSTADIARSSGAARMQVKLINQQSLKVTVAIFATFGSH